MEVGDGGGGRENDLLVLVQYLFASKYFSSSYSLPSTIESSHFSWSIFFAQFPYWNFFSSSNHLPLKISKR